MRFEKHFKDIPDKLDELFETKDLAQLKDLAHNIKSASKTIGAKNLSKIAEDSETVLSNHRENFTKRELQDLIAELLKVLSFIDKI